MRGDFGLEDLVQGRIVLVGERGQNGVGRYLLEPEMAQPAQSQSVIVPEAAVAFRDHASVDVGLNLGPALLEEGQEDRLIEVQRLLDSDGRLGDHAGSLLDQLHSLEEPAHYSRCDRAVSLGNLLRFPFGQRAIDAGDRRAAFPGIEPPALQAEKVDGRLQQGFVAELRAGEPCGSFPLRSHPAEYARATNSILSCRMTPPTIPGRAPFSSGNRR